jgi:hypothetical protein
LTSALKFVKQEYLNIFLWFLRYRTPSKNMKKKQNEPSAAPMIELIAGSSVSMWLANSSFRSMHSTRSLYLFEWRKR